MGKFNQTVDPEARPKTILRPPIIHHICNEVTINDCAQVCHTVGTRPTMAVSSSEAAEASQFVSAAVYNFGTFTKPRSIAIRSSVRITATRQIPVIVDPVGIHSYTSRRRLFVKSVRRWMRMFKRDQLRCTLVFRMNQSELLALNDVFCRPKRHHDASGFEFSGVDAMSRDRCIKSICNIVTDYFDDRLPVCFVITGRLDYVFSTRAFRRLHGEEYDVQCEHDRQGFPMMNDRDCGMLATISGGGCMLDSVIASYLVHCQDGRPTEVCFSALSDYVEAARLAQEKCPGSGHFRAYLMDELAIIASHRFSE